MVVNPVQTKLVPPVSRVPLLPRPALLDRLLSDGIRLPTILVCVGAGYGKTELAAALHRTLEADQPRTGLTPCWYTLDQADCDPAIFLLHLGAALDGFAPSLLETIRDVLGAEGGQAGLQSGLTATVNALFACQPREALLILDDFHVVEDSSVRQGVEWLLRHQPPNLHVMICSRRRPELEPLARQRVAGQMIELDESDLRLTPRETEQLFREIYDLPLDEEALDLLHARTDGWLAGIQLFQQYLRRPGSLSPKAAIHRFTGGSVDLFDYLGREVLAGEAPEVQTLLLRSSVLEELSGPLCDALVGRSDSVYVLEEAHRRRLFLSPCDESGSWYRLHPLFREFLRRQLETVEGEAAVRSLHGRAARWFSDHGPPEGALAHHLDAGEAEFAAEILATLGPDLIRAGRFSRLEGWLDRFDEHVKDEQPWLWIIQGKLAYTRGHGVLPHFDRALACFEARGDPLGASAARRGKAGGLVRLGRHAEAVELCQAALDGLGIEHHAERAEALSTLGVCAAETSDLYGAERYLDRALTLHRESGNVVEQARILHNLATIYLSRGQLRRALTADQRALELLPSVTSPLRAAILITKAWAHRLLGEREDASASIEQLQTICAQLGLDLQQCYALCLEGDVLLEAGDGETARQLYARAQACGHQLGEPSVRVLPWLGLTRVNRAMGRLVQARESADRALEVAREVEYEWYVGMALNELGAVHLDSGDIPAAAEALDEAATRLEALGSHYELALCLLRQAWLHKEEGGERFLRPLEASLELAEAEGYDYLLLEREAAIALPMLLAAVEAGVRVAYASRLLADRGDVESVRALLEHGSPAARLRGVAVLQQIGGQPALMALSSVHDDPNAEVRGAVREAMEGLTGEGPVPLRILTLGRFEVWRGHEQVEPSQWGGRRVKDLFKLLVVHRHEALIRDVVLDMLWPDLTADAAANNLSVTLSTLRRVLEPWLPPRRSSSYVLSADGVYRLNIDAGLDLDVDRFTELTRHALDLGAKERWQDAIRACRAAMATYQGEFLPENRYDDWAIPERERLSNLKGEVLFVMAQAWAGLGRLEQACDVCRELLHLQPFSERVHQTLMRYLAQLGRRAEALHQFDECRRSFEEELGVALSRETQQLRQRIAAGETV